MMFTQWGAISHLCPQGGLLNELLEILNGKGFDTRGYADDIVVLIRRDFEDSLSDKLLMGMSHGSGKWV